MVGRPHERRRLRGRRRRRQRRGWRRTSSSGSGSACSSWACSSSSGRARSSTSLPEARRRRRRARACSSRRRGGPDGVSGRGPRRPRPGAQPLALGRQVAPRDSALDRPLLPLDRVSSGSVSSLLRHPLHRALPPRDLRLQRRGAALDVARDVLLVLGARHGSLPAVHARAGRRLPGVARGRVPRAARGGSCSSSGGSSPSRTTSSWRSSSAAGSGRRSGARSATTGGGVSRAA